MAERLDKLKENLYNVQEEIKRKTEKFNKSMETLKNKESSLRTEIEIEEGKVAINEQESLNALLSECGYSPDELKKFLNQMKQNGTVTMQKRKIEHDNSGSNGNSYSNGGGD